MAHFSSGLEPGWVSETGCINPLKFVEINFESSDDVENKYDLSRR